MRSRVVEAIFFRPLDRRFFDQRLPTRDHAVGTALEDLYRFDVGHELRKALLILRELVDARAGASITIGIRRTACSTVTDARTSRGRGDARRGAPRARVDLAFRHDQRRLQTYHALLVERPRRGHAGFEHLGNDPAAVAFVAQLDADEQPESANFAHDAGYSAPIARRPRADCSPSVGRAARGPSSRTSIAASAAAQASSLPPKVEVCKQRRLAEGAIPNAGARDKRADRNRHRRRVLWRASSRRERRRRDCSRSDSRSAPARLHFVGDKERAGRSHASRTARRYPAGGTFTPPSPLHRLDDETPRRRQRFVERVARRNECRASRRAAGETAVWNVRAR